MPWRSGRTRRQQRVVEILHKPVDPAERKEAVRLLL